MCDQQCRKARAALFRASYPKQTTTNNQSVNDTKAHPQLAQVDYKLKFLKSVSNLMHRPELFQTNQTELKWNKN